MDERSDERAVVVVAGIDYVAVSGGDPPITPRTRNIEFTPAYSMDVRSRRLQAAVMELTGDFL